MFLILRLILVNKRRTEQAREKINLNNVLPCCYLRLRKLKKKKTWTHTQNKWIKFKIDSNTVYWQNTKHKIPKDTPHTYSRQRKCWFLFIFFFLVCKYADAREDNSTNINILFYLWLIRNGSDCLMSMQNCNYYVKYIFQLYFECRRCTKIINSYSVHCIVFRLPSI